MSSGGMRWGAGRPSSHVKAENCFDINVRRWQAAGALQQFRSGTWQWSETDSGKVLATIAYQVVEEGAAVRVKFAIGDKPITQRIPIVHTQCNFGGDRPWFICPRCGDRRAVLYIRSEGFGCRRCNRIVYRSQSEDAVGRAWLRQRKAEAKLDAGLKRPKGMHHATRARLVKIVWRCEEFREDAIEAFMEQHKHLW